MQVIFVGDIHGELCRLYDIVEETSDSTIIQVGDFGRGLAPSAKTIGEDDPVSGFKMGSEEMGLYRLNERARKKNNTIFAIRGNHDDPSYFEEDSEDPFSNIKFLPDYHVLSLDDINILCVGGAVSVDRYLRREYADYWHDECFVFNEKKLTKICESVNKIDIVVNYEFLILRK